MDDRTFTMIAKAIADPHRYEILQRISKSKGEVLSCSDARACIEISPATMSHHTKELETAGLIAIERDGKFAFLHLRRDVWNAYLKRLQAL